jgi:hypothetical protein
MRKNDKALFFARRSNNAFSVKRWKCFCSSEGVKVHVHREIIIIIITTVGCKVHIHREICVLRVQRIQIKRSVAHLKSTHKSEH